MEGIKIVEEKTITKPEFTEDIEAKIVGVAKIEDNIEKVKKYAVNLKEYYKDITFTPETMTTATDEKAQINKFKDKIADYRKKIVEEYNKPIKNFEETAKSTEKLLKETYDLINAQVIKYNDGLKEEIKEKMKLYFNEYACSKEVEKYLSFEELNVNITLGCVTESGALTKKVKETIAEKVDLIAKEIETIKTMECSDEILVEYIKSKDLSTAISEINKRHAALTKIQKENKEKEQEKITDEIIIKKIDNLTAPLSRPIEVEKEEKVECTLKITETIPKLQELLDFLDKGGYNYEQC